MVHCESQQDVQAYHDGELDGDRLRAVARHVLTCETCARELDELKRLSAVLSREVPEEMTGEELDRLHRAVDVSMAAHDATGAESFPIFKALAAAAASLLIIGSAWLAEMPAPTARPTPVMIANGPEWERIAVTMRVDPPAPGDPQTGLAVDSDLANWFLDNLQEKDAGANEGL